MSKKTFLDGLKSAAAALTPTLEAKLDAARADLAHRQAERDKAALDEHHKLPGSNVRLAEAHDRINAVERTISDLEAAQRARDAQEAAKAAQARAAAEAKQDKATQAEWDKFAAIGAEGEPLLRAYATWFKRLTAQQQVCIGLLPLNHRARQDLGQFSAFEAVRNELARITEANVPGANLAARGATDPREWRSLADELADLAKAVLPTDAKRRAA